MAGLAMAVLLLSIVSLQYVPLFCPVHSHAVANTFEPGDHLSTGHPHCHCFSMPQVTVRPEPALSMDRAFDMTSAESAVPPDMVEGFEIFHPPLSS